MVEQVHDIASGTIEYFRTQRAFDLKPALNASGVWALQNIAAEIAFCDTDVSALMWKFRRDIHAGKIPKERIILRFHFKDPDLSPDTFQTVFYLSSERDLCIAAPSYEVNFNIETNLVSQGGVLTGRTTIPHQLDGGGPFVSGVVRLERTLKDWLPFSYYIDVGGILPLQGDAPSKPVSMFDKAELESAVR